MTNLQEFPLEIWTDVLDYESRYQVSNQGRVKSLPVVLKVNSSTRFYKGKIKLPTLTKNGYLSVYLKVDGVKKFKYIHRLVAIAFIPNEENKPQVNHKDGNKLNNSLINLEWSTPKENSQHSANNGLLRSGENHRNSTITNKQAIDIKKLCLTHTNNEIISILGYDKSKLGLISNIRYGRTWKHV